MGHATVNLVVEDELSEWICRKLLAHVSLEAGIVYGKQGFGYIKTRLQGFNHAAKGTPYLVLADLDRFECAAGLWDAWVPKVPRHRNLIFRIAVREVESWLLADGQNLNRFFGLKGQELFSNPDELADPKREVLAIAAKSPKRKLREAIVFQTRDGRLLQGPDYNFSLIGFVENGWNLERAMGKSESLKRAVQAIDRFAAGNYSTSS